MFYNLRNHYDFECALIVNSLHKQSGTYRILQQGIDEYAENTFSIL